MIPKAREQSKVHTATETNPDQLTRSTRDYDQQKLAQDSNTALETYQKQVRTLEERNISLMTQQAEL